MKLRITKPDGTVIEAEGTAEECAALIGDRDVKHENVLLRLEPVFVPMPYPAPAIRPPQMPWPYTLPWEPTWTGDFTVGVQPATSSGRFD